jgi:hypothetical protein
VGAWAGRGGVVVGGLFGVFLGGGFFFAGGGDFIFFFLFDGERCVSYGGFWLGLRLRLSSRSESSWWTYAPETNWVPILIHRLEIATELLASCDIDIFVSFLALDML